MTPVPALRPFLTAIRVRSAAGRRPVIRLPLFRRVAIGRAVVARAAAPALPAASTPGSRCSRP